MVCSPLKRRTELDRVVAGRFAFRHVAPKPSPYNGPQRLTRRNYWAASNARNTGICTPPAPTSRLSTTAPSSGPTGWRRFVRPLRRGMWWRAPMRGGGRWPLRMEAVTGRIEAARDSRWHLGDDARAVEVGGGQWYTSSCGAPRELLVALNGFDELCDVIGGEDWHLGIRLEWSGSAIYYSRRMLTTESEDLAERGGTPLRLDKLTDEQFYMQRLLDFGVTQRATEGRYDSSHLLLDILYGTRSIRSIGNYYDLAELTEANLLETAEHFPRLPLVRPAATRRDVAVRLSPTRFSSPNPTRQLAEPPSLTLGRFASRLAASVGTALATQDSSRPPVVRLGSQAARYRRDRSGDPRSTSDEAALVLRHEWMCIRCLDRRTSRPDRGHSRRSEQQRGGRGMQQDGCSHANPAAAGEALAQRCGSPRVSRGIHFLGDVPERPPPTNQ